MILERLPALTLVAHFLALHLHRIWRAASNSAPPTTMPSAPSATGAGSKAIDVDRFDPNGGEMPIAAANRRLLWRPLRLRVSAEGRYS